MTTPPKSPLSKARQAVGRGMSWALFPRSAIDSLKGSAASVGRIKKMLTGSAEQNLSDDDAQKVADGKALLAELPARERFSAMAGLTGLTDEDIAERLKSRKLMYKVRLTCVWLALLTLPTSMFNWGFMATSFNLVLLMLLSITCLKDFCFTKQLEDRALWTFQQQVQRCGGYLAIAYAAFWPFA